MVKTIAQGDLQTVLTQGMHYIHIFFAWYVWQERMIEHMQSRGVIWPHWLPTYLELIFICFGCDIVVEDSYLSPTTKVRNNNSRSD